MMNKRKRLFMAIAATFVLTLLAVLLVVNFSSGEKNVSSELPRLYSSHDPQFKRALGSLLGPPLGGGNQEQALLNGEQIFPAMLAAIRGAQHTITFETYIY